MSHGQGIYLASHEFRDGVSVADLLKRLVRTLGASQSDDPAVVNGVGDIAAEIEELAGRLSALDARERDYDTADVRRELVA